MKLKLIVALSFLFFTELFSQQISWGVLNEKPNKRLVFDRIIGQDEFGIYVFGSQRKFYSKADPYIFCFEKNSKRVKFSKPLQLPLTARGKEQNLEDIIMLKGNSIMFTSYYDKDADKNLAYAGVLDKTTGSVIGNLQEVDFINAVKKRKSGNFDFVVSNDSTKILVYHNEPFDKYSNEKFSYKVIDSKLKLIWGKAIELPYKDKEFLITNYTLDNDGNVYMLAKFGDLRKHKKKEEADSPFKYVILSYNYKDNSFKEYQVDLPNKLITDITFKINKKGNLVCGGYYSDKTTSSIGGVFFMSIDKQSKKVLSSGSKDFDQGFMAKLIGERKANKGKEVANMDLNQFILRDDGGALLVGEQYYMTEICTTDPKTGVTRCRYVYHYNDIIVTSINPDASIQWNQVVKKSQASGSPYYLSYIHGSANGKLHLIFNDAAKNLELRKIDGNKIKASSGNKKSVVVDAIVNLGGTIEYKMLFNYKEQKVILSPNIYKQINGNQLLLLGEWGKKYNIGTMIMN